jgi:RHS repeat-associated protein
MFGGRADNTAWPEPVGREFDSATGLQYNWARYYDPAVGRWLTQDPMGFSAGDKNLYRYASNQTTAFVDPTGLEDYRGAFQDKVPWMPNDWAVHHTKQQRLRERYLSENGINVDDPKYLRGIPTEFHSDISASQTKWRNVKMKEMGLDPTNPKHVQKFWKTVPLSDVEAFEKKLEKVYSGYWIECDEKVGLFTRRKTHYQNRIANLDKLAKSKAGLARFQLRKASRIKELFPKLAGALGILALLGDNLAFAANIADHSPEAERAYGALESEMSAGLDELERWGFVAADRQARIKQDFLDYAKALGANDDTLAQIRRALVLVGEN